MFYWLGSSVFLIACIAMSCSKQDTANAKLVFKQPANFPSLQYNLNGNTITTDGFVLGRTLFYDPILSRDNTISCGSCHQQAVAFAHADHTVSHGIDDKLGTRNSPALQNLAFYVNFMWDGGVHDLDLQPLAPIENKVEMDEKFDNLLSKLNSSDKYKRLFKTAYGSEDVTSAKMLKALSQFMIMMVSADSKYDKYVRKEVGGEFTTEEKEGLVLFNAKCRNCHATDLFTDQSFKSNGLKPSAVNDLGRFLVTSNESDRYKFKVPSLRNVALTAPYMHDGRLRTLEAVLDHYRFKVADNDYTDPLLKQNGSIGIMLSDIEKEKIILFLKTLTDENFIRDKRFAEQ